MRKAVVVATLVTLIGLAGIEPARADFHGACAPGSGQTASVKLVLTSPSTLDYSGTVNCVGRSVTIDSFVFTAIDGNGRSTAGPLSAACTSCTGPVSVSGTYTLPGPGTYSLYMAFTVSGVAPRFRTERAVWRGPGTPLSVTCGGTDAANQQNFCPVPEGIVATALPAPEAMLPAPEHDH